MDDRSHGIHEGTSFRLIVVENRLIVCFLVRPFSVAIKKRCCP